MQKHESCLQLSDVSCLVLNTNEGTGSTHDSSVLDHSQLLCNPEAFFEDDAAYIVGNSAYSVINWVISVRKTLMAPNGISMRFCQVLESTSSTPLVEPSPGFHSCENYPLFSGERLTAMCNFMLDLDDVWEPTDTEQEDIDALMDEAYEGLVGSPWMNFIERHGATAALTEPRKKHAGKYKRAYLKDQLINWRGRPLRCTGWWRSRTK
jgi:hypothetical protein